MGKLIKGTHHIAIKCDNPVQYEKEVAFYHETLGMEILRSWGEAAGAGCMLDTGNSIMELFASGRRSDETGSVHHFALATDDVDGCVKAVRESGCRITMEPTDITIGSEPPYPARIAFCVGPMGEEIEFFNEK